MFAMSGASWRINQWSCTWKYRIRNAESHAATASPSARACRPVSVHQYSADGTSALASRASCTPFLVSTAVKRRRPRLPSPPGDRCSRNVRFAPGRNEARNVSRAPEAALVRRPWGCFLGSSFVGSSTSVTVCSQDIGNTWYLPVGACGKRVLCSFPRSGGRVLCVHGSGGFHRLFNGPRVQRTRALIKPGQAHESEAHIPDAIGRFLEADVLRSPPPG